MKLCSSYRDRLHLIDRLGTVAVPCGRKLRHHLARNSLEHPRRHSAVEARRDSRPSRSSLTSTLSKCFESFPYRRRHRDGHQSLATEPTLTVHLSMCRSGGCCAMTCDALASGFASRSASGDFLFCDDHYFALTFLSSFVIEAECLGSRLRSGLLSWRLWGWLWKWEIETLKIFIIMIFMDFNWKAQIFNKKCRFFRIWKNLKIKVRMNPRKHKVLCSQHAFEFFDKLKTN